MLRLPKQEESEPFSPEVDVRAGAALPFHSEAHALQSSFEAKEGILLAALPSPLTPLMRTPQARWTRREKDPFPLSGPVEVPNQCTTPVCSPTGSPSLSPINNTAMGQAATVAGAHLTNECGSTGKTTSTPARVAPGFHTQKTCTVSGKHHIPIDRCTEMPHLLLIKEH